MALASPRTSAALDPALLPKIHELCVNLGDIQDAADGFQDEIMAIAVMAMAYLDRMEQSLEHKVLKNALRTMWEKAEATQDNIGADVRESRKLLRQIMEGVRHD